MSFRWASAPKFQVGVDAPFLIRTEQGILIHRRYFVKSMLATAAGAPAYAALSHAIIPEESVHSVSLENGEQQLRLSSVGSPLTFQNFLRAGTEWKPSTLPGTPLITGPSLRLTASSIRNEGKVIFCEGQATAEAVEGKSLPYRWKAEISGLLDTNVEPWFRFRLTLNLPCGNAPQTGRQGRTADHSVVKLCFHPDGGSVRKLAARHTQPTHEKFARYKRQFPLCTSSTRILGSRP